MTDEPKVRRYLVRTAGADANVVTAVESDSITQQGGLVCFTTKDRLVYAVGAARLVDVRVDHVANTQ